MKTTSEQLLRNLGLYAHAHSKCMISVPSLEHAQALNLQELTTHPFPFYAPPLLRGMNAARIWLLE